MYSLLIFNCFEVFPVFDQPDLKAEMKLRVITHHDWIAISNENIKPLDYEETLTIMSDYYWIVRLMSDEEELGHPAVLYEFEETPRISTYLFAVCAGPWSVYEF